VALGVALDMPMTALSGGQAARAGLAALLLSRYDVLLLDEPTNDLDLDGLERLERYVTGPAVARRHRQPRPGVPRPHGEPDRRAGPRAAAGRGLRGRLRQLPRRTSVARRHAREAYEEYDDKRGALKDRAVMQRNWMAQGVRNARRKATDPDKHVKAFRQQTSEKQAAKARQTERAIERLEVVEEPRKEWELRMTIAAAPRSGTVVASLSGAVVRAGRSRSGRSTPASTGRTGS
jgi:ATPase subunit of ABC transporter with duplicated ATPase domains